VASQDGPSPTLSAWLLPPCLSFFTRLVVPRDLFLLVVFPKLYPLEGHFRALTSLSDEFA